MRLLGGFQDSANGNPSSSIEEDGLAVQQVDLRAKELAAVDHDDAVARLMGEERHTGRRPLYDDADAAPKSRKRKEEEEKKRLERLAQIVNERAREELQALYDQLDHLWQEREEILDRMAEIERQFQHDENGNIDWEAETGIARRPDESYADYQLRVLHQLEEDRDNGTLKNPRLIAYVDEIRRLRQNGQDINSVTGKIRKRERELGAVGTNARDLVDAAEQSHRDELLRKAALMNQDQKGQRALDKAQAEIVDAALVAELDEARGFTAEEREILSIGAFSSSADLDAEFDTETESEAAADPLLDSPFAGRAPELKASFERSAKGEQPPTEVAANLKGAPKARSPTMQA
jgi:hypothetical protein